MLEMCLDTIEITRLMSTLMLCAFSTPHSRRILERQQKTEISANQLNLELLTFIIRFGVH